MRPKFLVGGLIILAAVIYLIVSATQSNAEYFLTVEQVRQQGEQAVGRNLRVSGAVIGDTIQYDAETLSLRFDIADIPGDNAAIEAQGGLAEVLHAAVMDPGRARLTVVYVGPRPDLLQNEAQAIVTGRLGEDGIFYADEVLLKCPTRYEESLPAQAGSE
ncbi:MAG: cytochrome c maturation protein CcmE [Anaerolineales bacterium]